MAMTVGQKLRDDLHLIRTGWLDMNTGDRFYGLLDPDRDDDLSARYGCPIREGNPNATAIRGYFGENITGGHASYPHSEAIYLAYKIWPDVIPSVHDLEDIDMVNGAAEAIVKKAIEAGYLEAPAAQPPPPPAEDPCADVKAKLQAASEGAAAAVAVANSLNASLVAIKSAAAKARKVLPAGAGGGKYVAALRALCDAIDQQTKG